MGLGDESAEGGFEGCEPEAVVGELGVALLDGYLKRSTSLVRVIVSSSLWAWIRVMAAGHS